MAKNKGGTPLGDALLEGLREAVAWKRGEVALPVCNVPSLTAERVKAIRKSVAKTSQEFSRRFGIPVRTLEGWEQGRRQPDPAASVLAAPPLRAAILFSQGGVLPKVSSDALKALDPTGSPAAAGRGAGAGPGTWSGSPASSVRKNPASAAGVG